jgi:hypothetical protein
MLKALEEKVSSYVLLEAQPRWNQGAIVGALIPPSMRSYCALLNSEAPTEPTQQNRLTTETMLHYIHQRLCGGTVHGPNADTLSILISGGGGKEDGGEESLKIVPENLLRQEWFQESQLMTRLSRMKETVTAWQNQVKGDDELDDIIEVDVLLCLPTVMMASARPSPPLPPPVPAPQSSAFDHLKQTALYLMGSER